MVLEPDGSEQHWFRHYGSDTQSDTRCDTGSDLMVLSTMLSTQSTGLT